MDVLHKHEFTDSDFDDVQDFDCGGKDYQLEVSNWLKGPPDAADSASRTIRDKERPAKVYLYRLVDETAEKDDDIADAPLVGFGALSKGKWRWTGKKPPAIPVSVLIWYGVQAGFKRQPPGDEKAFYSAQILDDLIAEAMDDRHDYPIVGLCVHGDNRRAIQIYLDNDFTVELSPYKDKATGIEYRKMARILDPGRLQHFINAAKM